MPKGAGWADIIEERKAAGHTLLENTDCPEWTIYAARAHVVDHVTGTEARGPLKIGRGKYMNNIQRGRNQSGADFRVYARLILEDNQGTKDIEKYVKTAFADRKFVGPQTTQSELYDFKDDEIKDLISKIESFAKDNNVAVKEVKFYI